MQLRDARMLCTRARSLLTWRVYASIDETGVTPGFVNTSYPAGIGLTPRLQAPKGAGTRVAASSLAPRKVWSP